MEALQCQACFSLCEVNNVIQGKNSRHACEHCRLDIENWVEVSEKLNEEEPAFSKLIP